MRLTGFVQIIYFLDLLDARQNTANYAINLVLRKRCGYAVKKIAEQFSLKSPTSLESG